MQNEKPKDTEDAGPDGGGKRLSEVGAKALDIALGMASLTVEAAELAARYISEKAPEWVADLEERGRPVREQLSEVARNYAKPLPVETGDDEISALERRIRELESQVSSPLAADPGPMPAGQMASLNPEPTHPKPSPASPPFIAPDIDEDDHSSHPEGGPPAA